MSEIFDNACLIQLRTSCWTGTKQLTDAAMSQMGNDPHWLKGKKHLVNPEYLAPIKAALHKARKVLVAQALPFPISTLSLVPKETIVTIEQALQGAKQNFQDEVHAFASLYAQACEEAQASLGEHFSSLDYPFDIYTKFRMDWRFVTLSVPNKASVLPAHLYEAEREKFLALMQESRELAILSLRQEFAEIVSHLVDRLSETNGEKPKMIRNSMFDRFHEFWNSFAHRNLFQDEQLTQMVNQAKESMAGTNVQAIKNNSWLKQKLADEMGVLKEHIDAALEDTPRRQIRFADSPNPNLPALQAA